jgi:hypothetical protein
MKDENTSNEILILNFIVNIWCLYPNQSKSKSANRTNLNRKLQETTFNLNHTDDFSCKSYSLVCDFHFRKSNQTAILKLTLLTSSSQPIT